MNKQTSAAVLLALATTALPALAANSLTVVTSPAGANGTSHSLSINIDGSSTNNVYVEDDHPTNEGHYLVKFWINPSLLNLTPNKSVRFLAIGTNNLDAGSQPIGQHILLFMRHDNPAGNPSLHQYQVNCWYRTNTGTYVFFNPTGTGGFFAQLVNPTDGSTPDQRWMQFSVEFTKATGPGSNNGILTLKKLAGYGVSSVVTKQYTTLDTDLIDVDNIRVGSLSTQASLGTPGQLLFDEFESYR